jgi:hypothetical protein
MYVYYTTAVLDADDPCLIHLLTTINFCCIEMYIKIYRCIFIYVSRCAFQYIRTTHRRTLLVSMIAML